MVKIPENLKKKFIETVFGTVSIFFFSAALIGHARSHTHGGYPPMHIRSTSGEGQGFAIQNPSGQPNCLIVTAAHVVRAGDEIILTGMDRTRAAPLRVELRARVREFIPEMQLAILVPSANLPACWPLRLGDLDTALRSDKVGRTPLVLEANGESVYSRVAIEGSDAATVQLASVGSRRIEPGFSGSLVTLDDSPIGVIQRIDGRGIAIASRLDNFRLFTERFASIPDSRSTTLTRPAWDTSFLPKEYQEVYAAALDAKQRAEVAQRVAQANAQFAEDAELRAKAGSPGHAERSDEFGTTRGQVAVEEVAVGGVIGMNVRRITRGDLQGDVLLGQWKKISENKIKNTYTMSISGPGVWRREENEYNINKQLKFEGELAGPSANGRGVLTFNNGDISYSTWKDGNNNAAIMSFRKSDGSWFSGSTVDGLSEGRGIVWTRDGQVQFIGIWKKNSLVDDQTKSLTQSK